MEKANQNNGVDAADKASKSPCGFEPPENSNYQQWLYIAAIARQLNCAGLVGPVRADFCGKQCIYDFFQPERKILIKVYDRSNIEEYRNFPQCLHMPVAIVNVRDYDCRILPTNCFYGRVMAVDKELGRWLSKRDNAYLFYDRELWAFQNYSSEGLWIWHSVIPPLYNEGFDDASACNRHDEDDEDVFPDREGEVDEEGADFEKDECLAHPEN